MILMQCQIAVAASTLGLASMSVFRRTPWCRPSLCLAKIGFYIGPMIMKNTVLDHDKKFCCDWGLETSTFDSQMSHDFFWIIFYVLPANDFLEQKRRSL